MYLVLFHGFSSRSVSIIPHNGYESEDSDISNEEVALNHFLASYSEYEPNSVGQMISGPTIFLIQALTLNSNKD
jgi:hypothetical protein